MRTTALSINYKKTKLFALFRQFYNNHKYVIFIINMFSSSVTHYILSSKPCGNRLLQHCASLPEWHSANNSGNNLIQFKLSYTMGTLGSCVGSLSGRSCVFQESSHVQQCVLYSLSEVGSVCLLTAVEGCDGNVDMLIHGIVTHSVAIWHHWTKTHHAVCLRANLDIEMQERKCASK